MGGIVGTSNSGTIENCRVTGAISGDRAGGIMGDWDATIRNCFNAATVTGSSYSGGIVGRGITMTVKNCYNTGSIICTGNAAGASAGGVAGYLNFYWGGSAGNCYNVGPVSGSGSLGGAVGDLRNATISSFYYLDTCGPSYGIGSPSSDSNAQSKTADDFRFLAWDLGEGWVNCGTLGRPILAGNPEVEPNDSPIEITNLAGLNALRDHVNAGNNCEGEAYLLTADIDMGNAAWTPIDNFSGTFDGGGHLISGLRSTSGDQGLFSSVTDEGVVKNLGVSGTFSGNFCTIGGIVAHNSGTIENCYSSGTISSTNSTVGGVAGRNNGIIKNCYHIGSVTNDGDCAGGITGTNNGTVKGCYNAGTVSGGPDEANGYPGQNKCGGVVGRNGSSAIIKNCYNVGRVTSQGGTTGGVTGAGDEAGTVDNCYYSDDGGESFHSYDGQDDAISAEELADALNDSGGWAYSPELKRPVLVENTEGLVREGNAYYIPTLAALEWVRDYINDSNTGEGEHFYLTADIVMSGKYYDGGESWKPIGTESKQFTGVFDGAGHRIVGLYLKSNDMFQGLFGYVGAGGKIQNLGVADGSVAARYRVGGIAGINYGTIENCYNAASVTATDGTDGDAGGIAGNTKA